MSTMDFRTKTMFIPQKNPSSGTKWGIGVDIGYSGTKAESPNWIVCFPSFAVKVEGNILNITKPDPDVIFYRDRITGDVWQVGRVAQNSLSAQDADANSNSIYGRQRYFDPMFLVLARTAFGLVCRKNVFGGPGDRKIVVQTGLPNTYMKSDSPLIKEALTGTHLFDLKVGAGEWESFQIELSENNIAVMQQPLGTLLSVSINENGMYSQLCNEYFRSRVLICDPGFGTMDCFTINNGMIQNDDVQTMNAFTMKEVLRRTSQQIFDEYGEEIPIPSMQKYLEQGYFTKFNRRTRSGENIDFESILNECCISVAEDAVDKLCELYNDLLDYKYLIVTGGTGEAWFSYFKEALSGLPNLTIIPGNQNAGKVMVNGKQIDLPFIFSNVRGYYFYIQHSGTK